jgi:hypothetical protein
MNNVAGLLWEMKECAGGKQQCWCWDDVMEWALQSWRETDSQSVSQSVKTVWRGVTARGSVLLLCIQGRDAVPRCCLVEPAWL